MTNKIQLQFPEGLSYIAGRSLGKQIATEQVLPNLSKDMDNLIEIPNGIENIAPNFIQGFKSKLESKGRTKYNIEFKASNAVLQDKITIEYSM